MENIVRELIFIEEQAKDIKRKSEDAAGDYRVKAKARKTETREAIEREATAALAGIRKKAAEETSDAIDGINDALKKDAARIEAAFNADRERLTKEIFSAVTGAEV